MPFRVWQGEERAVVVAGNHMIDLMLCKFIVLLPFCRVYSEIENTSRQVNVNNCSLSNTLKHSPSNFEGEWY